jgi:AcrR family transcriptional regulator
MKAKAPARSGKERILDAAEQLFASRGFHGVTLREIGRAAEVDATSVSRYFGGKRELLAAVLERRTEILDHERSELLAQSLRAAQPSTASLEAILAAFSAPLLERAARGGAAWRSYCLLLASVSHAPELAETLTRHARPTGERFIAALRALLPQCPPQELYWGLEFLSAALLRTCAESALLDQLSTAPDPDAELQGLRLRLAAYGAAGLRALGTRERAPARGKRAERRTQPRR